MGSIAAAGDWANTDTMTPYVDIDTGGTPAPDLEIYLQNADGSDVLLAWTALEAHLGRLPRVHWPRLWSIHHRVDRRGVVRGRDRRNRCVPLPRTGRTHCG